VFQNIISNAIKYRGAQPPRIDISARCDHEEGWHFTLRDNGIGFRQEYAEQIFGMFKRLVNRRDYEGTGIGLAVVAKIIRNHGGRIWATSEPGVGTTIEFVLPDTVVQAPARIPAPRSGSAAEMAVR
jgi:signal transduction histidine kinase